MRQHLAKLIVASSLAGCSLVYNPSNLPDKKEPIDAPIADVNPMLLEITEVKSTALLEGAGQDGSAPQILVLYGMHILEDATLTVEPMTPNAEVMIQVSNVRVAKDHNSIAALVRAAYMDNIDEGTMIELKVTVTQAGASPQIKTWTLRALDELETIGPQDPPAAGKLYSRVNINGTAEFNAGQGPAIVKAVGSISITSITANAAGRTAGAGGCTGGATGENGACHGGGKAGNGGGGAGFAGPGTAGTNALGGAGGAGGPASGDELVASYEGTGAAMNKGAGGGGGSGGVGGGGGGTIELTAGGNIAIAMDVAANGAPGEGGGLGSGGGGGAGGVVVLRAGNMLTLPATLSLAGGGGGGGAGSGGGGSIGRWRYDAVTVSNAPPQPGGNTPAARRGPMLKRPANAIFDDRTPMLTVVGKQGDQIQLVTLYPDNTSSTEDHTMTSDEYPVAPPELAIGLNTVCVIVPGGNFAKDEAKNCIEAAFIP